MSRLSLFRGRASHLRNKRLNIRCYATPATSIIKKLEINCDVGEGFGRYKMVSRKVLSCGLLIKMMLQGPDEELMKFIDIANIACGYHAGDPSIMLQTVRLCKQHGIKTGAHPGLPDMFGFGRRQMEIEPKDIYAMVLYQVGGLKSFLDAEGVRLNHIKAHGELYFYMQRDPSIMRAVLEACAIFKVPLYAAKNEKQKSMCKHFGIPFQEEIYVDIDYTPDGRLVPVSASVEATSEDIFTRITRAAFED